jgi:hypothetical protein
VWGYNNLPVWCSFGLIDWLIDYDGVRQCLRTVATNGPIVHPPGVMWPWGPWWWWFQLGIMPDLSTRALWQSYHLRQIGGMDEGVRIVSYQYLKDLKWSLTCHKILCHGTSSFTSHPKDGVLRDFYCL